MRKQSSGATRGLSLATAALAAALLLTACGSDSDDHVQPAPGPPPAPTPTPTPTPTVDSFFAFVSQQVMSMLDMAEPIAIDSVPVTTPENTEPEPLK